MIIKKYNARIKLEKIEDHYYYVCKGEIDADEDVLIELDYPIVFEKGLKTKYRILSNVKIRSLCDIIAKWGIKCGDSVLANGDIVAGGYIEVNGDIIADGYIEAECDIKAAGGIVGGDIQAGHNIVVGGHIDVEGGILAGGDIIEFGGNIRTNGKIKADSYIGISDI